MKKQINFSIILSVSLLLSCTTIPQEPTTGDPLSQWNNTAIKQEIIDFVENVTTPNSSGFVAEGDRIAVFDNDGTLWTEKPLYIPLEYEVDYLKEEVLKNPELQESRVYSELANGNLSVIKEFSSFDLINALFSAHKGQKEEEYKESVYRFLTESMHPEFNRPYKELTYLPMLELVHFLQDNQFKVYIVTGGEITFVRTVSEEIYNISAENVIGSSVELKYVNDTTGNYLVRTERVQSMNDKQFKPANIGLHIGKKPIFAAGNSDGDYEMMQYTLSGTGPSMAIIVHHNDEAREYSYMHGTEKAIAHADSIGWHIVKMKEEFKTIFAN
jgi:phosphoserine phosphatase